MANRIAVAAMLPSQEQRRHSAQAAELEYTGECAEIMCMAIVLQHQNKIKMH